MQYDGMSAIQVLEDVSKVLTRKVENAEKVIRQTQGNIADMKNTIRDIDEFLADQVVNNRSKIDPQRCLHINKKIESTNTHETVTCADCGLMLSYKVI